MPSNMPSIARMGSKLYLDTTADQHNGHNAAWFMDALNKLDLKQTTKKKLARDMNITPPTLDKYIFIIKVERVQHGGGEQ